MRTILLVTVLSLLSAGAAQAASIEFNQTGWSSGATLSVSFSGQDSDGDGAVTHTELTSFNAIFDGLIGEPIAWTLSNIEPDGFVFADLDNYLFFSRNSNFSLVSTAFEGEALASVFDENLFPVDSTSTLPTGVPEPGGPLVAALALVGFAVVETSRRRRQLALAQRHLKPQPRV